MLDVCFGPRGQSFVSDTARTIDACIHEATYLSAVSDRLLGLRHFCCFYAFALNGSFLPTTFLSWGVTCNGFTLLTVCLLLPHRVLTSCDPAGSKGD